MTRRPTRNSTSSSTAVSKCGVCATQVSKYRCSVCPVRYCSVACYKQHKASDCVGTVAVAAAAETPSTSTSTSTLQDTLSQAGPSSSHTVAVPPTELPESSTPQLQRDAEGIDNTLNQHVEDEEMSSASTPLSPLLKPLSELDWPPEPDQAIFSDPLMKEDPKPLRREELLRIATSSDLRTLLQTTSLPSILAILDTLPPSARHTSLSRILEIDNNSLSKPSTSSSLISGRDSPPPLDQLLHALVPDPTMNDASERGKDAEGWYLRPGHGSSLQAIWIGREEKTLMRLFAGSVCVAIDGNHTEHREQEEGRIGWGDGNLEWEL